jgi:uncharacterized membrane protein YfhO
VFVPGVLAGADYALRAVFLPAGVHQVEFYYAPLAFLVGAFISAMTMGVVLLILSWRGWKRLKS